MITRWDPFNEMLTLRDAVSRLFEESYVRPSALNSNGNITAPTLALPLDVVDNGEALLVTANLPGFKPEDVNITVHGDTLTIQAKISENREDKSKNYVVRETRWGSYARTLTLPTAVQSDNAEAKFENGVLYLSLPKSEQAKPRQIKVAGTQQQLSEGTVNRQSSKSEKAETH